jgi:hypothetical protein
MFDEEFQHMIIMMITFIRKQQEKTEIKHRMYGFKERLIIKTSIKLFLIYYSLKQWPRVNCLHFYYIPFATAVSPKPFELLLLVSIPL